MCSVVGPATRTLLKHYALTLENVPAKGPKGILLKGDVLQFVQSKQLKPVAVVPDVTKTATGTGVPSFTKLPVEKVASKPGTPSRYVDIEVTNMRRTIAKRLSQSKSTIPHAYATATCNMTKILNIRRDMLNAGLKVSINDFVIKAVARSLSRSPAVNVVWEGNQLQTKFQVDISVAVATKSGLITPILKDVVQKSVVQIGEELRGLAEKARNNKLQPHEFMGGTFSVSNLGMYGINHFTAIINPPQCAILAVGGGMQLLNNNLFNETKTSVTLSYDATAITEEDAMKFLAQFQTEIETATSSSMGIYEMESPTVRT